MLFPLSTLCTVHSSACSAGSDLYSVTLQDLIISVRNGYGGQGRDTLLNTTLKVFGKDGMLVRDKEMETVQDLRDALKTHFGIIPDWRSLEKCRLV